MSIATPDLIAVTPDQKRSFDEDGYLVLPGFYSAAETAEMREQMNVLLRNPEAARPGVRFSREPEEDQDRYPIDPDNPHRVWMVFDLPLAGDYWFRQFTEPRIVDVMCDLLGPNLNFHNGKARIKPPGYRTHQGWHQDWPYERHSQPDLAAAITYVDDVAPGAASTYVVPGSHQRGEWRHDEQNIIPNGEVATEGVPIVAEAGTVAIIHVQVVHRASHNDTATNRSAIINEYKTLEALDQWGNKCAFAELPLRRDRQPCRWW